MLRSLALIIFTLLSLQVFGQKIQILDQETENPLEGVLVFGANPQNYSVSDQNGEVDFSPLVNEEIIYLQLFGYQSESFTPEEIKSQGYKVLLVASLIQMDQAVVSANRWRQNDHDIASKTRVISSENIELRNPANAADWLGSSGEVFIQKSQQGGGSPMIRGFSANRLLYSVDGIRMNNAIFRSGNLHNVISLDAMSLQSTEVLFGPGSVMYGSDAIGGVMSFQTLQPGFATDDTPLWSGNINSRIASASDERMIHGDISFGLKKWSFLSSLSYVEFGDLTMGKDGSEDYLRPTVQTRIDGNDEILLNENPRIQRFSGYDQTNFMQKVRFKPNDKLEIDYGFHLSNTSNIPRYDRLIQGDPQDLRSARWDYGPQKWMMNALGINFENKSMAFDQAKIKIAHQLFEESRITRRFGSDQQTTRAEKVNAFSLNADFIKSLRGEDFISYGAEVVYNRVESNSSGIEIVLLEPFSASVRYPESDWFSGAAYSTFHKQFSDRLKLQTGLRYNYISISSDFSKNLEFYPLPFTETKADFGALTGSLGLIFIPVKGFSISPVFATGFRAPNVDDMGKVFDSEPGTVLVPNPDVQPEYAYNWELNVNGRFNDRLKFEATGFYTLLDKALVRRPFTIDGQSKIIYDGELSDVLAIQNAAQAKVYGVQVGLEYSFAPNFLLTSRYNWQKGTEELDDESTSPSRHAAPAFGLTRITYTKGKLKAELNAQYAAEVSNDEMPLEEIGKPHLYAKDDNGLPYTPSWFILSVQGTFDLSDVIMISGGVENLTNQRYRPYSSGITAPGINFKLGINASF